MLTRRSLLASSIALPAFGRGGRLRSACQTNAWEADPADFETLLAVLRRIRALDFEGAECNVRFLKTQLADPAAGRRRIAATGIELVGAHTGLEGFSETALATVAESAAVAASLGVPFLVLSHGWKPGEARDIPAKITALRALLDRVRGIWIAYHNHAWEFENREAEMSALLEGVPKLKLLWDSGHAWKGGCDPAAFFRKHHQRVVGIHLRDFSGDTPVPLGQGTFPHPELAREIRKSGWSGWLINEDERPGQPRPEERATGPSRSHLRKVYGI